MKTMRNVRNLWSMGNASSYLQQRNIKEHEYLQKIFVQNITFCISKGNFCIRRTNVRSGDLR